MRITAPRHSLALSTAAAALLVLTACGSETTSDPGAPETTGAGALTTPASPTPTVEETTTPPSTGHPVAVRFVGDGPRGPVLFTETVIPAGDTPLDVINALTQTPADPDYRTLWAPGSFTSVETADGVTTVEVADAALAAPADASAAEVKAGLQQVAWTSKSVLEAPVVRFTQGGAPATTVLGVEVPGGEVKAGKAMRWLTKMQIDSPTEGEEVPAVFTATGSSNGFEAWVGWQLLSGDEVLKEGFGTAEGWMKQNYPWQVEVDLTGVPAGSYTLRFHTDDPSEGEGFGPDEDTKTIVLK